MASLVLASKKHAWNGHYSRSPDAWINMNDDPARIFSVP